MYIIKYINFWNKNQYIKNYIDFIEFGLKKCNIDTIIDNNCKNPDILISSVFGNPESLSDYNSKKTFIILITGENTQQKVFRKWNYDNLSSKYNIGAYISFDKIETSKRFRVPNWIYDYRLFTDEDSHVKQCICLNERKNLENRKKQISIVNSHGRNFRSHFYDKCNQSNIAVSCGGNFKKNDDDLQKLELYKNRKLAKREYLSQFVFNLCCENSNTKGYCTEKLLECVISGCIPIYWGDYDNEEIFNQERIIKCDLKNEHCLDKIISKIKYMLNNEKYLEDFFSKSIFTENAIEYIESYSKKSIAIAKKIILFKSKNKN